MFWLIDATLWQGCGELLLQDNCFCKAMAVSQAFIFHFKCYSILHFAVCQLLCWAFLLNNDINILHIWILMGRCDSLFRQICFAAFAYCHLPCLAVCVCVYPVWINVCSQVDKSEKKFLLYGNEQFQSNGSSPILLVIDLHLHFQGQNVWHFIILANILQMVSDRANITIANQ